MKDSKRLEEENRRLRQAVNELSVLNEIATTITTTQPIEKIIDHIVMKCIKHLEVEEGTVSLLAKQEEGDRFTTMVRKQDLTMERVPIRLDSQITGWMLMKKQPLMSNDVRTDERFTLAEEHYKFFHSILGVPLKAKGDLIGYLAVFNKKEGKEFTEDDRKLLSIIASQSAQLIENARLYEEEKEYLSMKEEMRLAQTIQMNLLPEVKPELSGYDISATNIPAKEVGGDYFDFISLNEDHFAFCIADITGKGMPAALLMSNLQASLRSQAMINVESSLCVNNINRLLYNNTESNKFATLFYGVLDTERHVIEYCNAGHDQPIHIRNGVIDSELEATGLILGVLEEFPYEQDQVHLEVNDVLVLYTDGITEAMNPDEEEFGIERTREILLKHSDKSAIEIQDMLIDAIVSHAGSQKQSDDITLMVIKRIA